MRRAFIYLGVVGLAAMGLSSSLVALGLLLGVLPGVLLLIAPTVTLYLPFADLIFTGARRRRGDLAALGLAGGLAMGFGAPTLGELVLRHHASDASRGVAVSPAPARVLFVQYTPSLSDRHGPWPRHVTWSDDSACEQVCAQMLLAGQVRQVVRPTWVGDRPTFPLQLSTDTRAYVYSLAPIGNCQPPASYRLRVPKALLAAIGISGRCITFEQSEELITDVVLTQKLARGWTLSLRPSPLDDGQLVRWDAWRCAEAGCDRTASAFEGLARPLGSPFRLSLDIGGIPTIPRQWDRRVVVLNSTGYFPWQSVGLTAWPRQMDGPEATDAPLTPLPRTAVRRVVAEALSASTDRARPFTAEEQALLGIAIADMANRSAALDDDDLQLLEAVIRHPTMMDPMGLGQAFRRHPEASRKLEAVLIETYLDLAKMEADRVRQADSALARAVVSDYRGAFRRAIGEAITTLPPHRLAVHRAELAAALSDPALSKDKRQVFRRVGY